MTDHSLTLGSLLLTDSVAEETHGYVFNVLASGMSTGSGSPVKDVVTSLLADGDLVRITRYGNREVVFSVEITGPTLGALAHGEAALRAEIGRRNLLTWQAPDVLSVPTVFEVVASEMAQTFDDLDELGRRRTFALALTCTPHALSADPVTVEALSAGSSTVVVDTCDATTGWAAATSVPPDSLSQSAGAVWSTDATGGNDAMGLLRSASIDVSAHPYFVLEWKANPGTGYTILGLPAAADTFPDEINRTALTDGWVRSMWLVAPGDLDSGFQFAYVNTDTVTEEGDYLGIREVRKTDVPPGQTARQLTRIISVGGTERTPASIHVQSEDGTTALGQCIVHTCPEDGSGYSPPLVRWRVSGTGSGSTDATAFSGEYEEINVTSWVAEVPTSSLPEGGYILVARLRAQTAGPVSITWSTSTIFPDAVTQQGFTVGAFNHDFAVGNEWEIVPIEVLSLPSVRTQAGKVQIALQVAAASPVVTLDEAWLFRDDDDCALTILETEQPHLWLDSPDVSSAVPTIWIGDGVDTKVHPGEGLNGMGTHVLSPEGTAVFTAALTDYPLTDATFYRRWHSNAAS